MEKDIIMYNKIIIFNFKEIKNNRIKLDNRIWLKLKIMKTNIFNLKFKIKINWLII
jgi:hypothetical protein